MKLTKVVFKGIIFRNLFNYKYIILKKPQSSHLMTLLTNKKGANI